jgi:menaquinone-dependent protoporphyrinogen oxidase
MNTLIVYASNHGTTAKVAEKISRIIGYNRCRTVNIRSELLPDLDSFDSIIIGGSIHFGKVQRAIRKFCEKNIEVLLKKKLGLFICYMEKSKELEEYLRSFPAVLINHAHAEGFFGGECDFDNMNYLEKLVVKKHLGFDKTVTRLDGQSINHFAIMMQ